MARIWSGDRVIGTQELNRRAAQAAAGFEKLGLRSGDGVALLLRNDFAYLEAWLGAGAIGAYSVAINWHFTGREAGYVLEDSGAKALVVHADLLPTVGAAIPQSLAVLAVATPPEIALAYSVPSTRCCVPAGAIDWDDWRDAQVERNAPASEAPATIIYTGGTTGRPKGVRRAPLTPDQAQTGLKMVTRCYGFDEHLANPEGIVAGVVGPVYHSGPNTYLSIAVRIGANVVLQSRFDAEGLLALIEQRQITHLHMVPIMFTRLLRLPQETRERYDLSSLRFVVHAAAPCPPMVKRAMIDWWGPIIHEYYGSTEMANVTFCTAEEWLSHPGTVGRPLDGAEVRVVGDSGDDLPPRAVGDVIGRMKGIGDFTYHGDEELRRGAERQGLIAPGDVGYFDEDGYLYLCSRSSDTIISGGANIYPAEIEAELLKLPGVADCAVFGIPDDEFGEAICAVVQPEDGAILTEAQILIGLDGRVARYMLPKRIEFRADLPREDSGKIFKRVLREPFWASTGRSI